MLKVFGTKCAVMLWLDYWPLYFIWYTLHSSTLPKTDILLVDININSLATYAFPTHGKSLVKVMSV